MPLDRRRKVTLAAGATGLAAVGVTAGYLLLREDRKGELLCPAAPLYGAKQIEEGDYVALQLGAVDHSFSEATWGRVLGRTWFGLGSGIKVELNSQVGSNTDPKPLQTEKHGFELGQHVVADAACVWDRYRPLGGRALLLCGPRLLSIPASLGLPTAPDPRAEALRPGDRAALVVAKNDTPVELIWATVVEPSKGGQALIGEVAYETMHPEIHGLQRGQRIEFIRDCVVEADLGGSEGT